MEMEKSFILERVELVPMRRSSVLSLFSLRKFWVNHVLISCRQLEREVGGRDMVGLVDR